MTNPTNGDILDSLHQKVWKYLPMCGNCAQTTFISLQEQFDLEGDQILKALTPFPGIALRGETCGAVTGSLMAVGLIQGRDKDHLNDWRAYIRSLPPARRFCRQFEAELGSTMCADIIQAQFGRRFDLADQSEAMQWMQCGALEKCGHVIERAVFIAASIILESQQRN